MKQSKIIAIDHGNRNTKTPRHVFPSSYRETSHLPAIGADVLIYAGKEYTLVDQRMPLNPDKTQEETAFVLSLFSVGKEIVEDVNALASAPTGEINVVLLVGLPPLHCKKMGSKFSDYFKRRKEPIQFTFNGVPMAIKIADVQVFPQAFAAAMTSLEHFKDVRAVNIVDIGGYTVDLLQLTNMRPDLSVCTSLYRGVNTMFRKIGEQERAKGAKDIPDATIEGILLGDKEILQDSSQERVDLVRASAKQFAREVMSEVSQAGLDLAENRTVFVGGGSILLRKYIVETGLVAKPIFVDNVHANAQGYLLLYENRNAARSQGS